MEALLGIDLGTTNIKALLVDRHGSALALARQQVAYDTAEGGRCELPAERLIDVIGRSVEEVCTAAGCTPSDIRAVSYGSQANTFLLLDSGYEPLTPLISWQDSRVNEPDPRLHELWDLEGYLETTGLGIESNNLAVAKIMWLQNMPVWRSAARIMTISDYLVYLLTGTASGDASTASMLGLYDVGEGAWWRPALEVVGVDESMLSEPVRPGGVAGSVGTPGFELFGLTRGIPVVAGALDHYAASLGAGSETVADACESTGTVVACTFTGEGIRPGREACFSPAIEGEYLLAFDSLGGTVLERYRAERCPDVSFAELDELAEAAGPGAGGVAAVIDDTGEARFSGTTDAGGRAERIGREARAILEATAFRLDRLVHTAVGRIPPRIVSTGGGAKSRIWTRIKAGVIGSRFVTVEAEEPAAYGGAYLAGRGAGLIEHDGTGIPSSWITVTGTVDPDPDEREYYLSRRGEGETP